MKRIHGLLLLTFLLSSTLFAQNIVNNPSLENYSSCPNGASAIPQAISWNTSMNSPEYLHSCSSSIYSDSPTNYFGFQNPASGNAYGGGLFYGSFLSTYLANIREHFYVTLSTPMVVGQTYYVEFKTNLCDNSPYATNKIGLQFCTSYNSNYGQPNSAHVFTNAVISDKVNWTTISGTIVPSVAYNALMIGNFFTDANCTVQATGSAVTIGYHGYYFVDDVYVSTTPVVLPIKWVQIDAEGQGNVAKLTWELEAEEDVDFYIIESSDDGQAFAESQIVDAVNGKAAYSKLDTMHTHLPTIFYRVRAVTMEGRTHLSPVVEAKRYDAGISFLVAYPSPVKQGQSLTVEYNSTTGHATEVQVLAVDGRLVHTETFPETTPGHHELQLSVEDLAPGAYILKAGSLTRKFMVAE